MNKEAILSALQSLGSDTDAVARTLRKKGIKGVRRSSCDCPIARFLKREGAISPRIGLHAYVGDFQVSLRAFPGVYRFVGAFDEGGYPDLCVDG